MDIFSKYIISNECRFNTKFIERVEPMASIIHFFQRVQYI